VTVALPPDRHGQRHGAGNAARRAPGRDPAEVAWVVARAAQGRGYAKEVASSLTDLLSESGWPVTAYIHPRHLASQHVARAAAMEPTDATASSAVSARHLLSRPGHMTARAVTARDHLPPLARRKMGSLWAAFGPGVAAVVALHKERYGTAAGSFPGSCRSVLTRPLMPNEDVVVDLHVRVCGSSTGRGSLDCRCPPPVAPRAQVLKTEDKHCREYEITLTG